MENYLLTAKHAYLIMAHNKFEQLEILLKLLDDEKHDFFIHIDKKAKNFDQTRISNAVKRSKVIFIKRSKVMWGGGTQIDCEFTLLKEATSKGQYEFYHFLSGVDLPIKRASEIYEFFHCNKGKNFVECNKDNVPINRIRYFYIFQEKVGREKNIYSFLQTRFLSLQRMLKVNRIKNKKFKFGFGANWFSITDELARYVITKEPWVKRNFSKTRCADEMFLQTIILNSKFEKPLYLNGEKGTQSIMRYMDWTRRENHGPHVFCLEDFEEIINSNLMFARKFDIDRDKEIIKKIEKYLTT